ncbi:MAG: DotI/IcmL family type IV secretion protein [Alphaproteobacteria bacterium]
MTIRFLLIPLFCAALAIPLSPAHAGLLEFFFPSLRDTTNIPAETLQAPFADPAENTETNKPKNTNPDSIVPLKYAHRSTEEITQWTETVVSNVMSFDKKHLAKLESSKLYYNQNGWAQYESFIEEKKILAVLQSGKYDINSYVSETPLLLNEGAVNDRYRWLYEVPVMISYIPRGTKDYKKIQPQSRNILLRIQVGRAAEAKNDMGVQIESWNGKVQKQK